VVKFCRKNPEALVKIVEFRDGYNDGMVHLLFKVVTSRENLENISNEIKNDNTLKNVTFTASSNGRIYGSACLRCRRTCGIDAAARCFIRQIVSGPEGELIWHIVTDSHSYRELLWGLDKAGVDYEVREVRRSVADGSLTLRQEALIRLALDLGYFDCPKGVDINDLANILGVTPATVSEMLRKGIKKALKAYFGFVDDEIERSSRGKGLLHVGLGPSFTTTCRAGRTSHLSGRLPHQAC